ncbi:MAG TPA: glycosyltransferase family 39 protein [Polyangiales bacterium]|nr:glycosyltransferase family 39 protein [Polyangiales bacterium]
MSTTRERWGRAPDWRDHAIGFGLCVLYIVLLIATADSIGLGRDEGIYVDAAQRYAGWLEMLFKAPAQALTQQAIDSAFIANHEHPPLMKLLFGVGYLAQREWHLFASDSLSFRFAGMLSAGSLLWIIYLFGTRLYGRSAGAFAALSLALLPRPFYHAHLNAFDVPITCASTLVLYNYYVALERPRRVWLLGATFGLALLTKHNSWFLPFMMLAHFGFCAFVERRARKLGQPQRLSLAPWGLLAALGVGAAMFYAGWPWLWHDTWPRLRSYVSFHTHHEYYNMEYFGVNYFWPPFPMSYAWVMTLFTVPLTTLCLGIAGAGRAVQQSVRNLLTPPTAAAPEPTQPTALLLGALLTPLLVITLPSTPIFGGTKHWFTAYPFLALFAGRAFVEAATLVSAWSRWLPAALASVLLLPAAVETAHSHPFALSYYTPIAGGVPGAAEKGMNRQFWGYTTRSLVPYLLEVMPNGGTLYICDTLYGSFQMLIRDGHLPPSFRATPDISHADYALVHHEKHFAEVDHQIWTTYRSVQPAHVLLYDGVPIISVYKNPKASR